MKQPMAKLKLDKLLERVELKSKFKFETFTGFALNSGTKGSLGKIGIQINVSNPDSNMQNIIIQNTLDNYVYPEIMSRVYNQELDSSYRPGLVHILLNSRSSKNKILLDKETNFRANYIPENDRIFENNERINFDEVKKITKIFPKENYMVNSAHIMLLKFKHRWLACVDLVFDRAKIKSKMRSAKEFLDTAEHALREKQWSPFVSSIWQATELAALSLLLFTFQGDFSTRQDHEETKKRFKSLCKNENVPAKFGNHYDDIYMLRKPAIYCQGINGDFTIKEERAKEFLAAAHEMLSFVNKTLEVIDQNRTPSGEQIMKFW